MAAAKSVERHTELLAEQGRKLKKLERERDQMIAEGQRKLGNLMRERTTTGGASQKEAGRSLSARQAKARPAYSGGCEKLVRTRPPRTSAVRR